LSSAWASSARSSRRLLKRAHLLSLGRPRPHAQRRRTTPRVRPSGVASHLGPFEQPARLQSAEKGPSASLTPRPHATRSLYDHRAAAGAALPRVSEGA
jgi:hypothetical protein